MVSVALLRGMAQLAACASRHGETAPLTRRGVNAGLEANGKQLDEMASAAILARMLQRT
jgi:hypothetical protein